MEGNTMEQALSDIRVIDRWQTEGVI